MHEVRSIEIRPGHRLYVEFRDGVSGELDLSDRLFGPVFEPLGDHYPSSEQNPMGRKSPKR